MDERRENERKGKENKAGRQTWQSGWLGSQAD